ncbi:MAG: IS21 family transposase, partial [Candidatus Thiodiazotropha endolucinida]|nr:IS21 family transposase [Candidatus Thiodiazotropha taylori]MCW4297756.1 IS21 family transposase [Candidatus Thiodiazotropha endolucinida]
ATEHCVTVYAKGKVVASHARKHTPGFTTLTAHMPQRHRQHQEWTPQRLLNWAEDIGPEVLCFIQHLLACRDHPEQAYRSGLGLLNLQRDYGSQRLNNACAHARKIHGYRLKHVRSILTSGKDLQPLEPEQAQTTEPLHEPHENIRGALSYQ